jgi:8-oxo-dGTP pyrophosphatase MutT (NUDIX family)
MDFKFDIVYKNPWFSVVTTPIEEGELFFVTQRDKVVILPYYTDVQTGSLKLVTLIEPIQLWGRKKEITAITGTIDKGENPFECAPRELNEETGLICEYGDNWDYLGEVHFDKGTVGTRYLFLVDVTGCKAEPKKTDGSSFEKNTKVMVSTFEELSLCTDLHLLYMSEKLKKIKGIV